MNRIQTHLIIFDNVGTISLPWIFGTSEDLRWSITIGKRPDTVTKLVQNHAQKVLLLGPKSKLATKSFLAASLPGEVM